MYGVYSISKLFLFVQTFIQEKDHISKVYNSKAEMEESLFEYFWSNFLNFQESEKRGLQIELESLNY